MQSKTARMKAIRETLEGLCRLQIIAEREQFDMLHYLLDMAFLEAEDILKQINRA